MIEISTEDASKFQEAAKKEAVAQMSAVEMLSPEGQFVLGCFDMAIDALRATPATGAVAMREAIALLRNASQQSHTAHFDKTGGSGSGCPECIRARELRGAADAILRAANPPAGAERATGPFAEPTEADIELTSAYPGAPLVVRRIGRPEPATPAVGEDDLYYKWQSAIRDSWDSTISIGAEILRQRSALLADVARLTEERDSARASVNGNAEKAAQWFDELQQARAALAAEKERGDQAATVLGAWHAIFGTTQLTHAKAAYDAALARARAAGGE